jgi:MFS family permease
MSFPDDSPQASGPRSDGGTPRWEAPVANGASPAPIKLPPQSAWIWLLVLGSGLVGGLAGFGIGEAAPKLVPPSYDLPPEIRRNSSIVPIEVERRKSISRDKSAALAYGGLGMVLSLALGAVGGLARGSPLAGVAAAIAGLVVGAAAGAGTTVVVLPSYHAARAAATEDDFNQDLALALRTHGTIWIAVGAAAGLALGLGLGGGANVARAMIGGILGAALAAAIYEFAGAIVFPLAQTFRPMAADVVPRLMAQLSVALCVAAGAFGAARHLRLNRAAPQGGH